MILQDLFRGDVLNAFGSGKGVTRKNQKNFTPCKKSNIFKIGFLPFSKFQILVQNVLIFGFKGLVFWAYVFWA